MVGTSTGLAWTCCGCGCAGEAAMPDTPAPDRGPFDAAGYAAPDRFYGYRRQVERFFELIDRPLLQPLPIWGLPGAGKTSFLHHVAAPAVRDRMLARGGQ